MLQATEETKQILQSECDEARFALKPWPTESIVIKHIDKSKCTCEMVMTNEERAGEIAAEIGKTLLQAQQLREKLAAKLHRERQTARKPDLAAIYSKPLVVQPATKDKSPRVRPGVQPQRRGAREPQLSCRSRQPTNFVLANKRSVSRPKSLQRPCSKSALPITNGTSSNGTRRTRERAKSEDREAESMVELDRLIERFTLGVPSPRASSCPVHSETAEAVEERLVVTMLDAVEGLDRLGVPVRLVGTLRTYHAFLKAQVPDEVICKKGAEAADDFLARFTRMSDKRKSLRSTKTKHYCLLSELSSLYERSHASNLNNQEIKLLKSKFISLDPVYNECDIKNNAGELKFTKSNPKELINDLTIDQNNWISNGIWNHSCFLVFKDIFGNYCTRYSDRNQLIQFHDLIQTVQKKVYETELIEVLLSTIIPAMKALIDPKSQEYVEIYKMIVAIIQIINIKVPVLAHVDN